MIEKFIYQQVNFKIFTESVLNKIIDF